MTKKLAVISSKGGVGKTTFTFHLCHKLAEMGKTVLAIDMDPQGSLSFIFLGSPKNAGIPDLYVGQKVPAILVSQNLYFIPTDYKAATITWEEHSLDELISDIIKTTDINPEWVIIDSPSSITPGTKTILDSVDSLVIPADLSMLALRGIAELMRLNRKPWMVLPMKVAPRQRNTREGMDQLTNILKAKKLDAAKYILPSISRKVAVDYAISVGKPVWSQSKYNDRQVVEEFDTAISTLLAHAEAL